MRIPDELLADAQAWVSASPRLPDMLHWHRMACPGCYRAAPEGPPVRCPEWEEIIADYDLATLAGTAPCIPVPN